MFTLIKWSVLDFVGENRNVCTAAVQKSSFVFPLQRSHFTKILPFYMWPLQLNKNDCSLEMFSFWWSISFKETCFWFIDFSDGPLKTSDCHLVFPLVATVVPVCYLSVKGICEKLKCAMTLFSEEGRCFEDFFYCLYVGKVTMYVFFQI